MLRTWKTKLALAAGAAVLAGACGTVETHPLAPGSARHALAPAPGHVPAPQHVPPPPDTGRDGRWGGFIGGGGR